MQTNILIKILSFPKGIKCFHPLESIVMWIKCKVFLVSNKTENNNMEDNQPKQFSKLKLG